MFCACTCSLHGSLQAPGCQASCKAELLNMAAVQAHRATQGSGLSRYLPYASSRVLLYIYLLIKHSQVNAQQGSKELAERAR